MSTPKAKRDIKREVVLALISSGLLGRTNLALVPSHADFLVAAGFGVLYLMLWSGVWV